MRGRSAYHRFDAAFAAVLAALCIAYLFDALGTSTNTANLILILPLVVVCVGLCAAVVVAAWRGKSDAPAQPTSSPETVDAAADDAASPTPPAVSLRRIAGVVLLLALFVIAMEPLGFEVALFGFVAATLRLLGERRPLFILAYAVPFSAGLVWILTLTLPYGVPTLLF